MFQNSIFLLKHLNEQNEFVYFKNNQSKFIDKNIYIYGNFFLNENNVNPLFSKQTSLLTNNYPTINLAFFSNVNDEFRIITSLNQTLLPDPTEITNFFYLRKLSFISFFINNSIDVPICFKKSKSLKKKIFELPLLRFTNFLMQQGKQQKSINFLIKASRSFFLNQQQEFFFDKENTN